MAPPAGTDVLTAHGARSCVTLAGATVAVFDSLATARAALEAVRRMHPGVSGVISIADTTGTAEDEAVIAAREATRSRAPDVPD